MGLDKPIPLQIVNFVGGVLRGDLGVNIVSRAPVTRLIAAALPNTIILAIAGLSLAALIGIPLRVCRRASQLGLLIG